MCLIPESYIASYVGRFAPPGYPNTTSTPSALRHSMIASTARIIAARTSFLESGIGTASLSCSCSRFGLDRDVGELELGPAARAQRVVQLHDPAAAGALAAQLVALAAVEDRRQQAEHGEKARDQEPEEERRALDPADEPAREREREGEDDVGHGRARCDALPTARRRSPRR